MNYLAISGLDTSFVNVNADAGQETWDFFIINAGLLAAGLSPHHLSGLCKFCYTNKNIPFKTANNKYGIIKVIRADEQDNGSMEIAVEIKK